MSFFCCGKLESEILSGSGTLVFLWRLHASNASSSENIDKDPTNMDEPVAASVCVHLQESSEAKLLTG